MRLREDEGWDKYMDKIQGLREYVEIPAYKEALGIPRDAKVVYESLAQGEYNINYWFIHPVSGEKKVLRVNTGSQMHLENQIAYEYHALELLKSSGRTPQPYYVDDSRQNLDYGVMVMEFLEGRALDYRRDMRQAAECLADIHSTQIPEENYLLIPENPLQSILDECNEMVQTYYESELGDAEKKKHIERMLSYGQKKVDAFGNYEGYRCCINTELNSGNFLINGAGKPNYLIDWEKPIYGDPAQDLGHFLAPTTTFWKTDVILTDEETAAFVWDYETAVDGRYDLSGLKERLDVFLPITLLRGITWCAMAWVQYQEPGRLIKNADTFCKMSAYLEWDFLYEMERRLKK